MERSIAQDPWSEGPEHGTADARRRRLATIGIGLAIVVLLAVAYLQSNPNRGSYYNHFVWQAQAFLEGRATIRYPVPPGPDGQGNDLFQDVVIAAGPHGETSGYAILPFPPLPAVLLMPLVAIWGLATDAQLVSALLGAVDVGIAFWVLGRLPIRRRDRIATTLFLGLGTVLWYAAEEGTTWYLAHVVAVGFMLLAIGVALGADAAVRRGRLDDDRDDRDDPDDGGDEGLEGDLRRDGTLEGDRPAGRSSGDAIRRVVRALSLDRRQVLAGLLFGIACTSRLTVVFGAPFFILVGGGGSHLRRGLSALVGMAVPIGALLLYTQVSTGHLFNPGYELLYQYEANGYPALNYHPTWSIEDPRYFLQNLPLLLAGMPTIMPSCPPGTVRAMFNAACPIVVPRDVGMGLFLTSPGWLIAAPVLRRIGRNRLVLGATAAIVAIAIVDLMHFSQGWVQFGYRFSNDYAPFGILLVGLALSSGGRTRQVGYALIVASVLVNLWGVAWGRTLGW